MSFQLIELGRSSRKIDRKIETNERKMGWTRMCSYVPSHIRVALCDDFQPGVGGYVKVRQNISHIDR